MRDSGLARQLLLFVGIVGLVPTLACGLAAGAVWVRDAVEEERPAVDSVATSEDETETSRAEP